MLSFENNYTNHEKRDDLIDDFSSNSEASLSYPIITSEVKHGMIILMGDERPAKVSNITFSKPGKHGSRKAHITGIDIFNHKKYEKIAYASATIQVPYLYREDYSLMGIYDVRYAFLMDKQGNVRQDIKFVETEEQDQLLKLACKLLEDSKVVNISLVKCMNIEMIEDVKDAR